MAASVVDIRLRIRGFEELRTSEPADNLVFDALQVGAEWLNQNLTPGFAAQRSPGRRRARATLIATTAEAGAASAREPAMVVAALGIARQWLRAHV